MRYSEAVEGLKAGATKAFRKEWNTEMTNHHIFLEKGSVMVTTRDWPNEFHPSNQDKDATDWIIFVPSAPAPQPIVKP